MITTFLWKYQAIFHK